VARVETAKEIVNITQDPSYLDSFDFDTALPEIARDQGVVERWLMPADKVAAKRQLRAKQEQTKMQIQALPNQAAKRPRR
jgi:hypothetical protein